MQITRLSVAGVGRFADETVIGGFGPGVNVLAAPNEAGKSTLFRALRICIFERHKAKTKDIEALRTDRANLPVSVSVDFSQDGHAYRISKSFLRSPSASLIADGREVAKDRAADEMLWDILGIEPLNNRSVDQAAFAMLWVGQRDSFALPPVTQAAENALGAAIEAEVGAVAGSDKAKTVLAELRAELARFITEKTGKPKADGPLGQAEADRNRCAAELDSCSGRLQLLDEQFARLAQLRNERARLADPAETAQHEKELAEARRDLQSAKEAADRLAKLETEERRCQLQLDSAAAKHQQLKDLSRTIAEQRAQDKTLAARLGALQAQEKDLRKQIDSIRTQINKIDGTEESDAERDRLLHRLETAKARQKEAAELKQKTAQLTDIMERRIKTDGELEACKVTRKTLGALEDIARALSLLDAQLASTAATVSLRRNHRTTPVRIGDRDAQDSEQIAVTAPVRIAVGDIAEITVSPPEGFGDDYEKSRQDNLGKQGKLLTAAGVGSLDEARKVFSRREELEAQRKGIAAELSAIGIEPDAADKALGDLKRRIANAQAEIDEAMRLAGIGALPEATAIEDERSAIATRREERRHERRRLDAQRHETQQHLEQTLSEKGALSGELDGLRRALEANLALSPDETREADIAEAHARMQAAQSAHQQAAGALADMRGKTPSADELEKLTNKTARLEQTIANRRDRLGELDRAISNIEGQIQSAGGDGLGEKVAALESQLALCDAEVAKHRRRVAILKRLTGAIDDALQENRDRFYGPILRHLKPFVADLFPGGMIEMADGFRISGLQRGDAGPESFLQLSDGTQEQIAVLVRLAMGALLAEQGKPVPVILDDALVFSDDDRIASMFDALTRAAQKQQIIVLTCRMRAFETLGGTRLSITDAVSAA